MRDDTAIELFFAAPPGLEAALAAEATARGFRDVEATAGGVRAAGDWAECWRANLELRGAARVLARIAEFRVAHLAQLDKRARKLDWRAYLRADVPVRVEVSAKRSRIYHTGAAAERIANAIHDATGALISPAAAVRVVGRIEDDLCTLSIDASGEPLHKRGAKEAVGKAPLRETMAALLLQECGYRGEEAVVDPMCGSGTLVLEAAEIAAGLAPGRARRFAFEKLAGFDAERWDAMRSEAAARGRLDAVGPRFFGYDRDAGAVAMSRENAERAGVAEIAAFAEQSIGDLAPPALGAEPGLVIVNPPYGERIGDIDRLSALYATFGRMLLERFSGWRVGLIATETALARATRLPFRPPGPPIAHGPLRIRLHRTNPLP